MQSLKIEFTARVVGAETAAQLLAAVGRMLEKGFQMTHVLDDAAVFTRTMAAEEFLAAVTRPPTTLRKIVQEAA